MIHPKQLVEETKKTMATLESLLAEENAALKEHQFEKVGELLESKKNMSDRLHKLLHEVKSQAHIIKSNPESRGLLPELEASWGTYEKSMRRNEMLLRAAHQSTTNFLDCVRDAINKNRPAAKTYGNSGQVEEKAQATSCLINTSI